MHVCLCTFSQHHQTASTSWFKDTNRLSVRAWALLIHRPIHSFGSTRCMDPFRTRSVSVNMSKHKMLRPTARWPAQRVLSVVSQWSFVHAHTCTQWNNRQTCWQVIRHTKASQWGMFARSLLQSYPHTHACTHNAHTTDMLANQHHR